MLVEAGNVEKLWNKGVDIAAGVITSTISAAIVAVVATFAWRIKLWLELSNDAAKQRQQFRIRHELEGQEAQQREKERIERLECELSPLVLHFRTISDGADLQMAWDGYAAWLDRNNLQDLPKNQTIIRAYGRYPFQQMAQQGAAQIAGHVASDTEDTQFA